MQRLRLPPPNLRGIKGATPARLRPVTRHVLRLHAVRSLSLFIPIASTTSYVRLPRAVVMIFEVPLEHLPQGASCSRPVNGFNRVLPPRMNGLTRQNSISGSGLHMTRSGRQLTRIFSAMSSPLTELYAFSARPLVSLTLATAHLLHHSVVIGDVCRSALDRCCRRLMSFGGGQPKINAFYSTRFWRQLKRNSREFSRRS